MLGIPQGAISNQQLIYNGLSLRIAKLSLKVLLISCVTDAGIMQVLAPKVMWHLLTIPCSSRTQWCHGTTTGTEKSHNTTKETCQNDNSMVSQTALSASCDWKYYFHVRAKTIMPLKCHICQLLHVHMGQLYQYELAEINNVTRNTRTPLTKMPTTLYRYDTTMSIHMLHVTSLHSSMSPQALV